VPVLSLAPTPPRRRLLRPAAVGAVGRLDRAGRPGHPCPAAGGRGCRRRHGRRAAVGLVLPLRVAAASLVLMRRALISLVAALALVGGGYALSHSPPVHAPNPAEQAQAVKLVTPQPGDLDLRQVKISAQLASGYTGTLLYD